MSTAIFLLCCAALTAIAWFMGWTAGKAYRDSEWGLWCAKWAVPMYPQHPGDKRTWHKCRVCGKPYESPLEGDDTCSLYCTAVKVNGEKWADEWAGKDSPRLKDVRP